MLKIINSAQNDENVSTVLNSDSHGLTETVLVFRKISLQWTMSGFSV